MTTRPLLRALVAGFSLALLTAACSGGDDGDDLATPTAAANDDSGGEQATPTTEAVDDESGGGDAGDVDLDGLTLDELMDMDPAELEALLSDPAALEQLIASFDPAELEAALAELGLDDMPEGTGPSGGGGGSDGDASGSGDACALGAEEIAALVGPPADTAAQSPGGGGQGCTWTGEPGQLGTRHTLSVTVWPGAEFYRDPAEFSDAARLDVGLGDESWIDTEAGHVMWKRGDLTVDVYVPLGGPSEAELLTVARAVDEDLG